MEGGDGERRGAKGRGGEEWWDVGRNQDEQSGSEAKDALSN